MCEPSIAPNSSLPSNLALHTLISHAAVFNLPLNLLLVFSRGPVSSSTDCSDSTGALSRFLSCRCCHSNPASPCRRQAAFMTELWQQAVKWLNAAGVLPPDCSALQANARVYDLALALQVS